MERDTCFLKLITTCSAKLVPYSELSPAANPFLLRVSQQRPPRSARPCAGRCRPRCRLKRARRAQGSQLGSDECRCAPDWGVVRTLSRQWIHMAMTKSPLSSQSLRFIMAPSDARTVGIVWWGLEQRTATQVHTKHSMEAPTRSRDFYTCVA